MKFITFYLCSFFLISNTCYSQFVVTNGNDSGPGSLREAVDLANAASGADEIIFDGNFTIFLNSGQITLQDDVTITGNGMGNTILDGANNGSNRILGAINLTDITIEGITFQNSNNTGVNSSALGIGETNNATISNCEFLNNSSNGELGSGALGVRNTNITISGCIFEGNTAINNEASGGAIGTSENGTVTIINTLFSNNTAVKSGGALEVRSSGDVLIQNSKFLNNTVTGSNDGGGAFFVLGNANTTILSSEFIENNTNGNGGAIYNQAQEMTIEASTILRNEAANGGGIFNDLTGVLTVDRSTISGNISQIISGGILNNGGTLLINASTIVFNTASAGGGVFSSTQAIVANSIISVNNATGTGKNVSGNFASDNYNLIGEDDLNVFPQASNDMENTNPLLDVIQDNGGETMTHKLLANSPAYNAANPSLVANDQIDQPIFGGIRDIGAYESQTDVTLSNNDFELDTTMILYPNPSSSVVTITVSESIVTKAARIVISELASGKQVFNSDLTSNEINIVTEKFAAGVYLVSLLTNNGLQTEKLIIQ